MVLGLLEAMLVSLVLAPAPGHIDTCGRCRYLKPRGFPWAMKGHMDACGSCSHQKQHESRQSVLLLTSFIAISMNIDSQLRMRDIDGFCENLSSSPPKPTQEKQSEQDSIEGNFFSRQGFELLN